jgi:hypothetical protein
MELKEAIAVAKQYIRDVFAEEHISDVGLEEVEFDDASQTWGITIGFSRPYNTRIVGLSPDLMPTKRDYKVVRIKDVDKRVLSVKNREAVS